MAGRATHDPGRATLVLAPGDPDRVDSQGRNPPGLRQTEGPTGSIIDLLGLTLAVPDHTTLSWRVGTLQVPRPRPRSDGEPLHLLVDSTGLKLCGAGGAGQGSARGARGIPAEIPCCGSGGRRGSGWSRGMAPCRADPGKLPISLDASTRQIVAAVLTTNDVDDASQVSPLLDQVAASVASFTADGAYDQEGVTAAAERHPGAAIIVPLRCTAVPSGMAGVDPPLPFHALRAQDLGQLRLHSGTATCRSSPSTAKRLGRKRPGIPSGPGLRLPLAGPNR